MDHCFGWTHGMAKEELVTQKFVRLRERSRRRERLSSERLQDLEDDGWSIVVLG